MKRSRILVLGFLLLQTLFSFASPNGDWSPNNLPAPAWINAVEITSSSIKIKWAKVPGAVKYKVSRFDVTHNVQLPDAISLEEEFTSAPHDQGTTISFEVSGIDANEVQGNATTADYTTTWIVVDDIVSFTIPNATQGNILLIPGAQTTLGFTNAGYSSQTVLVQRHKVKYTDKGTDYFAEFLVWSHCSNGLESGARLKYWNMNTWPTAVTKVENHIGGVNGPIISINFKVNEVPFFTLQDAYFLAGVNGNPNTGSITLKNDRTGPNGNIYFEKSNNVESNPCYDPHHNLINGGGSVNEHAITDEAQPASDVRNGIQIEGPGPMLIASPNPFSNDITAHYTLDHASNVTLTLFDQLGRVQKTIDLSTLESGFYSTSIHTNDLPTGIYFLSLQTNDGHIMTKLVKN